MIRVEHLRRSFEALVAVDDVSFEVRDGEVFGLLGPNGAGKTTTLNMICGVLQPDAGRVLVDGRDIWRQPATVKRELGVVPQEIAVYEDLTARDNFTFWGSLYGLKGSELAQRMDDALLRVGLADRSADRVATDSGGMKRRLSGDFANENVRDRIGTIDGARVLRLDDDTAVLAIDAEGPGLLEVLPRVLEPDLRVDDVSIQRPNLQSVFIALTGRELRD